MNRSIISTAIVIICIIIIGLYAAGEVNYFSHKTITEKNITSPVVIIDKAGIIEKLLPVLSEGTVSASGVTAILLVLTIPSQARRLCLQHIS